jgi:hypothetical protein
MPIYEYQCNDPICMMASEGCPGGLPVVEMNRKIENRDKPVKCPVCGKKMTRRPSSTTFRMHKIR